MYGKWYIFAKWFKTRTVKKKVFKKELGHHEYVIFFVNGKRLPVFIIFKAVLYSSIKWQIKEKEVPLFLINKEKSYLSFKCFTITC